MTEEFYNIEQDKESGHWQFRYKRNKYTNFYHKEYETAVLAAYMRDHTIRYDDTINDKSDEANQLTFTDDDFRKLQKVLKKGIEKQPIISETPLIITNPIVAKILRNYPAREDIEFADEAFVTIKNIYIKHAQQAYLEVANYIAETFFNNDIDLIKKKTPMVDKGISFHQLCLKLIDADSSVPSKSWLYNSLGLFVDRQLLEKGDKKVFHTYGKLSASHQVKLLTVDDDKKIKLIKEIANNDCTVRELQKRIDTINGKPVSVITYVSELKGIKKDLNKRLQVIQELPDPEDGKVSLQDIENLSNEIIEKVDRLISDLKD